jgi:hypothetical protein
LDRSPKIKDWPDARMQRLPESPEFLTESGFGTRNRKLATKMVAFSLELNRTPRGGSDPNSCGRRACQHYWPRFSLAFLEKLKGSKKQFALVFPKEKVDKSANFFQTSGRRARSSATIHDQASPQKITSGAPSLRQVMKNTSTETGAAAESKQEGRGAADAHAVA